MRNDQREKIGKLVQLARRGVGGERKNALAILKRLCEKNNLDIKEVLEESESIREYVFKYRRGELTIAARCALRYGCTNKNQVEKLGYNTYRRVIIFETTKERYIETINAYDILSKLYREEKKRSQEVFEIAFIMKHDLNYKNDDVDRKRSKEPTQEEIENMKRASLMTMSLKTAQLQKRLADSNKKNEQ